VPEGSFPARPARSVQKAGPFGTLALLLSILAPPPLAAQEDLSRALAAIDSLDSCGEFEAALALVEPLLAGNADHAGLLRRQAEVQTDLAVYRIDSLSVDRRKALCVEALAAARRSAELEPGNAEGWFQVAQAAGYLSELPGGGETVEYCRESKAAFEQALACDPEHVWALHGLAIWHRQVAAIPGTVRLAARVFYGGLGRGSNREAERLFKEAIRLNPGSIRHHLELGKTYLEMKEWARARAEFERVLGLPERLYFDGQLKGQARELLTSMRR
jgi:tetratricopeptide (TPR) repeat protein